MDPDLNKRPTATVICHRVGGWLDEMKQDDDDDENEVKRQFFEADNFKPKVKSSIHPKDLYTSKSINTRKIMEALRSKTQDVNSQKHLSNINEGEISQKIAVEIAD
ncbi:putative Non-specific protein-tyrosine kinase [Gigaspora margarita]|uniref:Putative Non-specific protein-tyrosine kinase n=1 Tax=Gigaspora margarita TaxID=4874 RepID=A0A8H4A677_GIGMA|nr:putative Non-specific protein-tyrosine kinase [Gigaspora margarita]